MGKAILAILGDDILRVPGSVQLSTDQPCGTEAAIHAMQSIYEELHTEAI